MFDNDNVNDIHDNVDYKYDDNRLFQFSVMIAMIAMNNINITLLHTSMWK